jgi:hypothetical protein
MTSRECRLKFGDARLFAAERRTRRDIRIRTAVFFQLLRGKFGRSAPLARKAIFAIPGAQPPSAPPNSEQNPVRNMTSGALAIIYT